MMMMCGNFNFLFLGLAEAARGRANSSANSQQLMVTKTAILLLTSLGVFLTTSHAR